MQINSWTVSFENNRNGLENNPAYKHMHDAKADFMGDLWSYAVAGNKLFFSHTFTILPASVSEHQRWAQWFNDAYMESISQDNRSTCLLILIVLYSDTDGMEPVTNQ